jgi:hypothetical protein
MVRIRQEYRYRPSNQFDKRIARNKLVFYIILVIVSVAYSMVLNNLLSIKELTIDYLLPFGLIVHSINMILDATGPLDGEASLGSSRKLDYFLPLQDPNTLRFGMVKPLLVLVELGIIVYPFLKLFSLV